MSFPWYEADVPADFLFAPEKRRAMYEGELRERAALLLRLGFPADQAKLRLRGNLRWDFELHRTPAELARVDSIVDQVFAAGRAGVGGPPSLED